MSKVVTGLQSNPVTAHEINNRTVSDPQKREIAKKNKLNYVVLWNLEEIERYKNELLERVLHTGIHNLA